MLASSITQRNPASTAMMVAKTVLITEKHPLTPHAHGMRVLLCPSRCFNPIGKGMPIKNATGDIRSIEKRIFRINGKPIDALKRGVRTNAYSSMKIITSERTTDMLLLLFVSFDDIKLPIPDDINIPVNTAEAAITGFPK